MLLNQVYKTFIALVDSKVDREGVDQNLEDEVTITGTLVDGNVGFYPDFQFLLHSSCISNPNTCRHPVITLHGSVLES